MKTMETRRIVSILLAFVVVFGIVITAMPNAVYAAESLSFDSTDVMDDLMSSTANGTPFDIKNYPFDENKPLQVIGVVEYCYSFRANMRDDYAIYLYVYNPQGLNIDKDSKSNKIQMAVSYLSNGTPRQYEKFDLECVSVSAGDYKNLFYKFKVIDRKVNETTFADRVNSMERRYDISGIELMHQGEQNAREYGIGGTYKFRGYAAGCGADPNAKSTLTCVSEDLETITLEVHHANFRTNVSSLGKNHYNEVNAVYFAVPERIFETYGNLQKIHAEWWEYKTKMATVTSNREFYEELLSYVGTYVGEYNENVPVRVYAEYSGSAGPPAIHNYGWTYNVDLSTKYTALGTVFSTSYCDHVSDIMPYAFYAPAVDTDKVFSYLYSKPVAGSVEGTVVQDWIYTYKNNLGHGYINCNGRLISKDLFETYVDEGRKMGYNNVTIDLADTFDLNSYDSNHTWWDKLWDYGFSWPSTDGDYRNIAPIYEVQANDLSGTAEDVAKKLLINKDDVSALKSFYAAQTAKGNRVILFRFANTDYYSAPAFRSGYSGSIDNTDTYVAQQTVFFDFDIIDMTFNKEGVYRVIPVVSSPMDIVNGFDPPATDFEWWKAVVGLLMLILLIVILAPILPYIVKTVIWVLLLPAKAIKAIVTHKKQSDYNDDDDFDEEG